MNHSAKSRFSKNVVCFVPLLSESKASLSFFRQLFFLKVQVIAARSDRPQACSLPGVVNQTKPNQKSIEPNRSIVVRLVRQSNIIELELFGEFD